jgi:hypothetical protein
LNGLVCTNPTSVDDEIYSKGKVNELSKNHLGVFEKIVNFTSCSIDSLSMTAHALAA